MAKINQTPEQIKETQIVYKTLISAMCKIQSAVHDLEKLPEKSSFKKDMKKRCNEMLNFNRNFMIGTFDELDTSTKFFNLDQSQQYINTVAELDKLDESINVEIK